MIWIPLDEADCCHSALYFISSQSRQSCGKGKHNLSRQIASGSATRVWECHMTVLLALTFSWFESLNVAPSSAGTWTCL